MKEIFEIDSNSNVLFVTNQCNNHCIMCCQPPQQDNDFNFYYNQNVKLITSAPKETKVVCITGGEPLIHPGLKTAIAKMKAKGYKIKLDTNGTYPDYLKELIEEGLVDYVAMDIKNAPAKYAMTAGVEQLNLDAIEASMHYLMENHIPYEFRTTIVKEFHEKEDIEAVGKWIKGAKSYYLQNFENNEHVIDNSLHAVKKEVLEDYKKILLQYVEHVEIRGVE